MDSTVAASPATFCAISAMIVNVVTALNLSAACAFAIDAHNKIKGSKICFMQLF